MAVGISIVQQKTKASSLSNGWLFWVRISALQHHSLSHFQSFFMSLLVGTGISPPLPCELSPRTIALINRYDYSCLTGGAPKISVSWLSAELRSDLTHQ